MNVTEEVVKLSNYLEVFSMFNKQDNLIVPCSTKYKLHYGKYLHFHFDVLDLIAIPPFPHTGECFILLYEASQNNLFLFVTMTFSQ